MPAPTSFAPIKVRNPRTGERDYLLKPATPDEVAATADRLRMNQPAWLDLGLEKRVEALNAFADAVQDNRQAIFDALCADTGRVLITHIEIDNLSHMTDRMAGYARGLVKNEAARNSSIPTIMARTQLVPFPLVGIISPWNFPFLLGMIDSVPALIAGSAILYKPSEITPRHVDPVRECFNQIPELADVVDYAMGAGATGQAVIDNVDAVCFTGSVRTGRLVAERAASNFIPAFLEMGGKDPAIVLESADLERTATVLLRGSVAATGQACQSVERIYVARPLHDALVARLAELAANVTLNTEAPDKGHIGPLIFEKQLATIQSHIDDAVEKGATLHCGGQPIEEGGTWYPATVLSGVHHGMRVMTDETFGPVLPVMAFDTVDEAVELANDSRYGLSASVFAGTEEEGLQVARRMHGGVISVNEASLSGSVHEFEQDPFNYSGLGRSRMGPAGVERFYRHKLILTDQSTEPRGIDQYAEPATNT